MKKIISILLCAVLLCTAAPVAALAADEDPFVPVLRFIACSDSHVKADNDRTFNRIGAMLTQAYALADGDGVYQNLDALLIRLFTRSGRSFPFVDTPPVFVIQ